MALLKKSDNTAVIEELPEVAKVPEEMMGTNVITQDEVEAIECDATARRERGANTERLELATGVVSSQFGLDDDYRVNKFDDKGKVVKLTLENSDFVIAVTIKDSERHGMYVG